MGERPFLLKITSLWAYRRGMDINQVRLPEVPTAVLGQEGPSTTHREEGSLTHLYYRSATQSLATREKDDYTSWPSCRGSEVLTGAYGTPAIPLPRPCVATRPFKASSCHTHAPIPIQYKDNDGEKNIVKTTKGNVDRRFRNDRRVREKIFKYYQPGMVNASARRRISK